MCIYSRGAYNTVRSGQRHLGRAPLSSLNALLRRIYVYKSSIPCLYPSQYALSFSTVLVYFISTSLCILFTMFSRLSTFSLLLLLFHKSLKLRSYSFYLFITGLSQILCIVIIKQRHLVFYIDFLFHN